MRPGHTDQKALAKKKVNLTVCCVQLRNVGVVLQCQSFWWVYFSASLGRNAFAKAHPFLFGSPLVGLLFSSPVSLGFWPAVSVSPVIHNLKLGFVSLFHLQNGLRPNSL